MSVELLTRQGRINYWGFNFLRSNSSSVPTQYNSRTDESGDVVIVVPSLMDSNLQEPSSMRNEHSHRICIEPDAVETPPSPKTMTESSSELKSSLYSTFLVVSSSYHLLCFCPRSTIFLPTWKLTKCKVFSVVTLSFSPVHVLNQNPFLLLPLFTVQTSLLVRTGNWNSSHPSDSSSSVQSLLFISISISIPPILIQFWFQFTSLLATSSLGLDPHRPSWRRSHWIFYDNQCELKLELSLCPFNHRRSADGNYNLINDFRIYPRVTLSGGLLVVMAVVRPTSHSKRAHDKTNRISPSCQVMLTWWLSPALERSLSHKYKSLEYEKLAATLIDCEFSNFSYDLRSAPLSVCFQPRKKCRTCQMPFSHHSRFFPDVSMVWRVGRILNTAKKLIHLKFELWSSCKIYWLSVRSSLIS